MFRHSAFPMIWLLVVAMTMATVGIGAEPGPEAARLSVNAQADGTNYFAISMKAPPTAPVAGTHDVIVLINTSAGQVGEYRTRAFQLLDGLLQGLQPTDRVALFAVDLGTIPLSSGFVAPQGDAAKEAIAALERREPLGATDLDKALATVIEKAPAGNSAKAAVFIGDGMSRANLLTPERFEQLTKTLTDKHIPVNCYAIGGQPDLQMLGALAGRTGGVFMTDIDKPNAREAGAFLAAAARTVVEYPKTTAWPAVFTEVYPRQAPPLRSDRESVVIGSFKGAAPSEIQMTVETPAGQATRTWKLAPVGAEENTSYLPRLVALAKPNGGMTLPLVDRSTLREAEVAIAASADNLTELARRALASGDTAGAKRMAEEALKQDTRADKAQAVLDAAQKRLAAEADANLSLAKGPGPGAGDSAAVDQVRQQQQLAGKVRSMEVQNSINLARQRMTEEPDVVLQNLRIKLEEVKQAPELAPDVRDQLVDQLQAALKETARRKVENDHRTQMEQEQLAIAKERLLVNSNLERKTEKLSQLMERFNALMDEGRYRMAEEQVAVEAQRIAPENFAVRSATLNSRTMGYYSDIMALRVQRQKAVIDTLYQCERSLMPFPDDPPIVYPDAEVWKELTARRSEKYRSMDLSSRGKAEKVINDALKSPTECAFNEQSLGDVLSYLKDRHKIEIQPDQKALDDVGVTLESPITKNLKGVSLRSALRLILKDLGLTYVIQDEVLLITSPDEANNKLSTKVYPVADLVVPIRAPAMTGGFGGLNGMSGGGMSGGGGSSGGGMGGMMGGGGGGGGMGGGMGGGGGGLFSVDDDLTLTPNGAPATAKASAPAASQAKPKASASEPRREVKKTASSQKPAVIHLNISDDASVAKINEAWDRHLARRQECSPESLKATVRHLWNSKPENKYDQIVALIRGALRHQQSQPWMYEALTLALRAKGAPKEEIERAVMSAVEFAQSPTDLMFLAIFLEQLGLEERSLSVCRQIIKVNPLLPVPYVQSLRLAQKLGDLEATQWASLGVLGQAWPEEHKVVWRKGYLAAMDVLERLKKAGRTSEAASFERAMNQVSIRDCVVCVSWTGEAEVDLMVEEPSGKVCSLRYPRTPSGGVFLGDAPDQVGKEDTGAHTQVYVCPSGFSGDYRLFVRRVWGTLSDNKVKVAVWTHYHTDKQSAVIRQISLEGDAASVRFDLADGRRTDSLHEQQVANAATLHMAVGQQVGAHLAMQQQVLAQRVFSNLDQDAMDALSKALAANGATSGSMTSSITRTISNSGAVGYQPVIIVLPEGCNLAATAVISADRRYVRVTALPLFSGVSKVTTFNMATGAEQSGGGGSGGKGFSGSGMSN